MSGQLTRRQVEALRAAADKGGAWFIAGSNCGGAIRRMCERLAALGLVAGISPYPITAKGRLALASAEAPHR